MAQHHHGGYGPSLISVVCLGAKYRNLKRVRLGFEAAVRGAMSNDCTVTRPTKKAMIDLLPEHQPLPVWKHSGSKRERFSAVSGRNLAQGPPGVRGCKPRKMRRIARFQVIVHGSFDTAHNLKVTGSNPVPATKYTTPYSSLRASLTGGFLRSTTRGSTVEARGREVLRNQAHT